jgi:tetratricopeptide (TPR) repeat protein
MPKKKRPPIPAGTIALLQTETGGRCAIPKCEFSGQEFHHIDGNPSNNLFENLIYLCGSHHNEESIARKYGPAFFRRLKMALAKKLKLWNAAYVAPITDIPLLRKDKVKSMAIDKLTKACADFISPLLGDIAELIHNSEYQSALTKLRKAESRAKKAAPVLKEIGPRLYNQMGLCEFHLGRIKPAERYYQRGLAIRKTWKLQFNLANLRGFQGRIDEMLALARSAYRSKPTAPQAMAILAIALTQKGGSSSLKRALNLLRRAYKSAPDDAGVALNLAKCEFLTGNLDEGVAALKASAGKVPPGPAAELLLGTSLQTLAFQNIAKAKGFRFEEGILQATRLLGEPHEKNESVELKEAIEHFEKAIALGERDPLFAKQNLSGTYFNIGSCHSLSGRRGAAFRMFRKSFEVDPTFHQAQLRMLTTLVSAEHFKWATAFAEKYASHFQGNRDFKNQYAVLLLQTGKYNQALPMVRELAQDSRATESEFFNLATVLGAMGDFGDEYQKARARILQDDIPRLNWNVAHFTLGNGECSTAKSYLEDILRTTPDSEEARELLAQITLALQGPRDAKRVLGNSENTALARGGSLAWAGIHIRDSNWNGALQHLSKLTKRRHNRRESAVLTQLVACFKKRQRPVLLDMGCTIVPIV